MYTKLLIYISVFSIFIMSCGGSGGGNPLVNMLKKDTKTKSAIIVKNASKVMIQSIELANKLHTYKEEDLPKGLDCIKLGFTKINRDINLSLVGYSNYTKKIGDKSIKCEIFDYSKFDENISGKLNKIFILSN